ncbi:hypothetical protein K8R47_02565 [archaeon]|nr:hypothetical protein [archaeon]
MERLESFTQTDVFSVVPNFKGRFTYNLEGGTPVRAYFFEGEFEGPTGNSLDNGIKYLKSTLEENPRIVNGASFLIAGIWSNEEKDRMLDLFKYGEIKNWSKNTEFGGFAFRNGVYVPDFATCEDTAIILSAEAKHRRRSAGLEEYMQNVPNIDGLIPEVISQR